jgi:DNA-binding CsgD family transcriptional regulator
MAPPEAVTEHLRRGRRFHAAGSWSDAYEALSLADRSGELGAADLELLATSVFMLGRDEEYLLALERAYAAHVEDGELLRAARCAFWLGLSLLRGEPLRGEPARARGWLGRGQRLLDRHGAACVEHGYFLLPVMIQHETAGDYAAARATAREAVEIAERFGDPDLLALGLHAQGLALTRLGRVEEGLTLVDEAMLAVTAGELSPVVTGVVYCSTIEGCQQVYALRHAQEWTAALTRWCEQQPDMVAFTGRCLVHRAELMQLHGAWPEALEESRRAADRRGMSRAGVAQAFYRQGEVHRLRGDLDAAEDAYRNASRQGWEPQPGLALLRQAQGNGEAASASIRRAIAETSDPLRRAGLLAASVEIQLAAGDVPSARSAGDELAEIAAAYDIDMVSALAEHAGGAVALAEEDAEAALVSLRRAWQLWEELEAPYEAARARELVGLACRALGDEDAATLEQEAAREVFDALGAALDVARLEQHDGGGDQAEAHGLTARELQVLRLVAAGATNKAVAADLVLSERTVDRHVSNIFRKLGVSSRAAATAYAYEQSLL